MYRKDFVLRMIEMLAELLAGILGLIKKGDYERASASIDSAYQNLLTEDAAFFDKIPLNNLTDVLIKEHNYSRGHLEILSELLYAQAELTYAQKEYEESFIYYCKSLLLLDFVIKKSKTFSFEKQARVSYLKKRIAELEKGE